MNGWTRMFSVELRHDFFADGVCRGLALLPDAATAAWLARGESRARATAEGLELWSTASAVPATRWLLCPREPLFALVTDWPRSAAARVHLNAARARPLADGARALQAGPALGAADLRPLASPRLALPLRGAGAPALGVLRVPRIAASEAAGRLRLALAARRSVWKYWLFGDWDDDAPQVVDPDHEIVFTPAARDLLDAGLPGWSTRSTRPIELRERGVRRFQLRGDAGQVLIRRLPVAAPAQFTRETIDGVPTLVSEIFVHR